ncbi:MAG: CBS domain-containing protein [Alphaproteobacteria bacterium]|nr:CBS domain-containing protein [Alphaproteobacteria bacterium]
MFVADILREKGGEVISVGPEDSALSAARTLSKRGIGSVLVRAANGEILGILSERDLLHGLANDAGAVMHRRVRDLMTRTVETCQPDDTLHSVMGRMTTGRFRHLPVVEQNKLLGIVSIGDVVKNLIAAQAAEAEALKAYITTG